MGKTKKLYLAKRMLAMILAVAMSVTMVPQTVFAAPADDTAVEDIVDAAAEKNDADIPADGDVPGDGTEQQDTGDTLPDGTAADGASDADGTEGTDDAVIPADKGGDDAAAAGNVENTDPESADGGNTEIKTEPNAEGDTPAVTYEISIESMETEAVYDGYEPFDTSLAVVKKTENGKTADVEGETPTAAWKVKGADGNFTALTGAPVNVGEYELTLTCAAVANVHDALTKVVPCTITKAPLTIKATANAKPGDKADKANVTVTVNEVIAAEGDPFDWMTNANAIALEVTGIREAYGSSLTAEDVLKENGDYVVDVKPSLKADAAAEAKEAAKNYELEAFTADVVMAELAKTQIKVTLADKWKDAGVVTLHVYDGKAAAVPALTVDYTCEVQCKDDAGNWKKLDGAEAVGEWKDYPDCEKDETGKIEAPVDAGEYTYILTYEDETGKYAKSSAEITVVIDPAPVTVEMTNDIATGLTVPAGTLMTKVLSQVKYKATAKDRSDAAVTIDAKKNHIWGTGYDDKNVSQIYEPAFTLQVKDGSAWKDISDADYRVEGGKEYRVIYDGGKAIYNADGTYAHRTGINSGLDESGEEINGVDANYITDETPTADASALKVVVQAGVEMEWDLKALLEDGKANAKLDKDAVTKEYDAKALYETKADYKNKVKLSGGGKTLNAVGSDFTYTWYKNTVADDLLDIQIADQNKANGFAYDDYEQSWTSQGSMAPTNAGVYKLEITYEDNTDDDTFYYVKDDKAAEVYFVIDRVELTVAMEEGTYETWADHTPYEFFVREKKIDDIKYTVQKDGAAYTFPEKLGEVVPQWGVLENIAGESGVDTTWYPEDIDYVYFSTETGFTYEIQAQALGYRRYYENGEYNEFNSSNTTINRNYTLYRYEIEQTDVGGKNQASKKRTLSSDKRTLTVKADTRTKLALAPKATLVAYERSFNGKALTKAEVKPEEAYTLTANGQPVAEDPGIEYMCVETETGDRCMLENQRDAGVYDLYACFWGNETYAPLDLGENPNDDPGVKIGTVTISKCQISLELDVDETYEAGYMEALWSDTAQYKVTGNEECDDEWAFSAEGNAWGYQQRNLQFYVNKKGSKERQYEGDILHRDGEFEIHYDAENSYLSGEYDRNYEVKNAAEVLDTFKTVAAPAEIRSERVGSVKALDIGSPEVARNADGSITQTVNVREGIPYTTYSRNGIQMEGNLAAFAIYAPEEFGGQIPDTAMYKNEVEGIDGKVVGEYTDTDTGEAYFVVLFDAAEGKKTVNIRWADKYIETIILNLDENLCLGDLTKAVAPKSLAFNAAPKKLAVGSSAQLDVKITKAQMTDVVCLGYESDHPDIMHVDPESGYVTALKKDKATITVYPKQMDKDGKMVRIPNYKPVTVTIEGTAMTAPKSVKVKPQGNTAYVNYDRVADGYRREIYVVDNTANPALKKAADIETKVKEMQGNKNQWRGTFAIAPVYLDSADESYGRSYNGFWYKAYLSGLKSETSYTVYVRNVCEAKTLPDGYRITQETVDLSAAGTAVSFKSLKSEATGLNLALDETLDGIDYMGDSTYRVELSEFAKGLESKTTGWFYQNVSDQAADRDDIIKLELPIKDKNSVYQDPKLEYYVYAEDKNGDSVIAPKNDFVSVDKKGKIKLTGVTGWAYYDKYDDTWYYDGGINVYVRDSSTGRYDYITLIVVADVDSVTAKKKSMNLTVGQEVELNDVALYNYKAGKSKLTSYQWPDMDMDAVRTAVKAQKEYFELDGTTLRAIKDGGTLKLSLTDRTVKRNAQNAADATAEITFVTKELAQVKKIKAFDITNDKFGLTFTSAGYPDAFRVEIRDAANNLLLDKRYEMYDGVDEVYERAKDRDAYVRVKDTYRIDSDTIKTDIEASGRSRLAKESQYAVKITALYGSVASKEATAKVKTTKIPAVSGGLNDDDGWYWDYEKKSWQWDPPTGGMSIQVSEYESNWNLQNEDDALKVLSGNSYTLTAEPSNRGRVNDTLVWTVGDKKVATVKAAAGTYCITLKGMQPGRTTLEVRSKILGKAIARYDIYVAAVEDAYKDSTRFYGDDEPENPDESYNAGHDDNAPEYLPLSVGDRRKTKDNEYRSAGTNSGYCSYFSFTAPETGEYQFSARGNSTIYVYKKTAKGNSWGSTYRYDVNLGWLEEGETVYLKSRNSYMDELYSVEIEQTQRMEAAADGMTVTGQGKQENFQFKAPKAGLYQFTLTDSSNAKEYLELYTDFNRLIDDYSSADESGDTITYEFQKDEIVWLKTSSNLSNGKTYTLGAKDVTPAGLPAGNIAIPSGDKTLYTFTAPTAGLYRLAVAVPTASAGVVTLKIWDNALDALKGTGSPVDAGTPGADVSGTTTISVEMLLEAGQTVYLNPVNGSDAALTVGVTGTKDDSVAEISAAGTPVALETGKPKKFIFVADSTGIYEFTAAVDASVTDVNFMLTRGNSDELVDRNADGTMSKKIVMKAGQTVIWEITSAMEAVSFSLKGELKNELDKLGLNQPAPASVLGSSEAPDGQATAAGFVFSAPKDGYYSFWSESNGSYMYTYGILWDIDQVDADTCLLRNGMATTGCLYDNYYGASYGNFGMSYYLNKGQTVYLKSMMYYDSDSGSFTVHVAEGENAWYN